jgi:hypothetical protein
MRVIKGLFRVFIEKVFFNKKVALIFCLIFSVVSIFLDLKFKTDGLFSSSGSIYTNVSGFILPHKFPCKA